jgi:hypothetical protein
MPPSTVAGSTANDKQEAENQHSLPEAKFDCHTGVYWGNLSFTCKTNLLLQAPQFHRWPIQPGFLYDMAVHFLK